jgi:hypothetical protein
MAALTVTTADAQGKPDFSGTWAVAGPYNQVVTQNGKNTTYLAPYGRSFTLKQDDKTLTISTVDETLTVALDGTPTRRPRPGGGEYVTTAAWNAAKLTITTTFAGTQPSRTLSLDANGGLTIAIQSDVNAPSALFAYTKKN